MTECKTIFPVPFDVKEGLKSGFYISATTGHGKSDLAMYFAKQLMKAGVIVIVFDSTQDWQKRSSIPYYTTIRRNEPIDFRLNSHSIIYDIHELFPKERQKLVEVFCALIYKHQSSKGNQCPFDVPKEQACEDDACFNCEFILAEDEDIYCKWEPELKQYFIIFEEAQTYLWQNSLRSKKAQNTAMCLTEGRNYKIRFGCIVQFASMVDKNAMRYMKQRYFGWTNEPNDVDYIKRFFPQKHSNEVESVLQQLDAGTFLYESPNRHEEIHIEPFVTKGNGPKYEPPSLYTNPDNLKNRQQQPQSLALGYFVVFLMILGWLIVFFYILR